MNFLFDFSYTKDAEFVKKAVRLKYNFPAEYKKLSHIDIIKFCPHSFMFINAVNWHAVVGADEHRVILKTIIVLRALFLIGLVILVVYCFNKFI